MPRQIDNSPIKLEDQCLHVYLNYLHDEMHLIFHLKNFQDRSVLLRQYGLSPDRLYDILQDQLSNSLQGILHDIVRQKMLDILISQMHLFISDMQKMFAVGRPPPPLYTRQDAWISPRKANICGNDNQGNMYSGDNPAPWFHSLAGGGGNLRGAGGMAGHNGGAGNNLGNGQPSVNNPISGNSAGNTFNALNTKNAYSAQQYRALPIFQLFELILHKDLRVIGKADLKITIN